MLKEEIVKAKRGRPKGKSNDKRSFGPLGDLIRKKRLERNLGLSDVSKAVRCLVQFISNIEHGRAPLPWEKAERLAAYLEIPMDELQAANLSIRADFKSFMAASKPKKSQQISNRTFKCKRCGWDGGNESFARYSAQ